MLRIVTTNSYLNDENRDWIIDFSDVISVRSSDAVWLSNLFIQTKKAYLESINNGDLVKRRSNLYTELIFGNHIIATIKANNEPWLHDTMLRLSKTFPESKIIYTLVPNGSGAENVKTITSDINVDLTLQNATVYYKEFFPYGSWWFTGQIKYFDLSTDWVELSQESTPYDVNGKKVYKIETFRHKGYDYDIETWSNIVSSWFTYPKFIDCRMTNNHKNWCHLGPYIIYSAEHEERLRTMVKKSIEDYISTPEFLEAN